MDIQAKLQLSISSFLYFKIFQYFTLVWVSSILSDSSGTSPRLEIGHNILREWTSVLLPTRFVKSQERKWFCWGGAETYSLLRNLVAPAKPSDKSYDELVRVMNEHQNPKPSVIINSTKETGNRVRAFLFMWLNLSVCQNIVILRWLWKIWLETGWFVVWGVWKFSNVCWPRLS